MCQLLETIKIVDRNWVNIGLHSQRFNKSRNELFGIKRFDALNELIEIPTNLTTNVYRCRVIYSHQIDKVQFLPHYQKKITTIRIVEKPSISYSHKFLDRNIFEQLVRESGCDDVLITQNGLITDSSFANIVFFDGNQWITPSSPLLKGTQRAYLLQNKLITEAKITVNDICNFRYAKLINALRSFSETDLLDCAQIY